jgi:hypothetical protein
MPKPTTVIRHDGFLSIDVEEAFRLNDDLLRKLARPIESPAPQIVQPPKPADAPEKNTK